MLTLYGIPNCDSVRQARAWLAERGLAYRFHDLRRDGLDRARLLDWIGELGWEQILNRRGQLWRRLPEEARGCLDQEGAVRLMLEEPGLIKRPLLDTGTERVLGFSSGRYQELLG